MQIFFAVNFDAVFYNVVKKRYFCKESAFKGGH